MRPRWQEIEKEIPTLKTEYYDYDTDKDKISGYKVDSGVLPVFIFEDKDGNELTRLSGEIEKDTLLELIKKYQDR
jgi:thioredoxin-related protein